MRVRVFEPQELDLPVMTGLRADLGADLGADLRAALRWGRRAAAPPFALALAALVLWRFPPQQHTFYPRCPVFEYLHLECPGCGSTRALAELLRGHLASALRLNALSTLSLPLVLRSGARAYRRYLAYESPCFAAPTARVAWAALAVCMAFGVARNL